MSETKKQDGRVTLGKGTASKGGQGKPIKLELDATIQVNGR